MTDARLRSFWHRTGPAAVFAMLAVAATTEGCSCGDDTEDATTSANNPSGTSTSTTTTSTSSTSGPGGAGGTGGTGGSGTGGGMEANIDPAAQGNTPFDATPDPDGKTIYFTADDPMKGAGVFKVAASGGAVTEVKVGDPFIAPFGIAIGTDGTQLYVADPAAETGSALSDDSGAIYVLPITGGSPAALAGTPGLVPRGLEVHNDGSTDQIVFSGRDKTGAGVFQISASGGAVVPVATGAPFVDPTGVAIAKNGDIYVADTVSAATRQASIIKIAAGTSLGVELVAGLEVGYPAGVALTSDDNTLLVSGLDPTTLTDVVIQIDLGSMTQTQYKGDADTDITAFFEPAGLHRAKNKDVFAWADSKALAGGTVFVIVLGN